MRTPDRPELDDITLPRAALDRLTARIDALEAEVRSLRGEPIQSDAVVPVVGETAPSRATTSASSVDRRRALAALAGVAVAGTAAAVAPATTAAAANGDGLVLGSVSNGATAATGVAVTGTTATYGLGVTDNGLGVILGRPAVFGHAKSAAFGIALRGLAEGTATAVGASAADGTALDAASGEGLGVRARTNSVQTSAVSVEGGRFGLSISPAGGHLLLSPMGATPATATTPKQPGTVLCSGYRGGSAGAARATLWACVTDGQTAADFRVLAGPGTAGALHVLPVPIRIYDSRPGTSPSVGPKTTFSASEIRTLDLTLNNSGVPAGATAALLSILLVNTASGAGNFTVWAGGAPRPQGNTMVWGGSAGRHSTTALSALDASARVQVSPSVPTHLVVDVVGYYR